MGVSVFTTDLEDNYYGNGTAWFADYGGGPGFPYNPGQQTGYLGRYIYKFPVNT